MGRSALLMRPAPAVQRADFFFRAVGTEAAHCAEPVTALCTQIGQPWVPAMLVHWSICSTDVALLS